MSDNVLITIIVTSGLVVGVFFIAFFASGGGHSNFESFVEAWKAKRTAELEIEKLKANHERVCPRLTDPPRKS